MTVLARAENVSLAIGGKTILDAVSLAVAPGEIRAVVGPSGAGKSTLARCLAAVARGWTGSIEIGGRPVRSLSRKQLARSVCYLPQSWTDVPEFTVGEYVGMARYAYGGFWRARGVGDGAIIDEALNAVGLSAFAVRPLSTLSGGQRQLAALAAALAQESDLMILDEPVSSFDPKLQEEFNQLMLRLNRAKNVSFVIITHDVNTALKFTDKTLALRDGGVVFDGPSAALADGKLLRDIYAMEFALVDAGAGERIVVPASWLERGRRDS